MLFVLQGIGDWMLLLGVGAMVAIDLLILVIYTIVEGSRGKLVVQLIPNRENPTIVEGVMQK